MICPIEKKECVHACENLEYKDVNEPFCHMRAVNMGKPFVFSDKTWECPKNIPDEYKRGRLF